MRQVVAAAAALLLVGAVVARRAYVRQFHLLSEAGARLRRERSRAPQSVTGCLILGWGGTTGHPDAIRQVLDGCVVVDDGIRTVGYEIYVSATTTSGARHSAPNLLPLTSPITLHIALFPLPGALAAASSLASSAQDWLELGVKVKAALLLLHSSPNNDHLGVYVVERSVYTEYGEYDGPATHAWEPSTPRTAWPPTGTRSPYIIAHTCFAKPARFAHLSNQQWAAEAWFPRQSPMSEMMQPRARYVRNVVVEAVDQQGDNHSPPPPFAGVVIEAWPSARHMRNPFLFFNASTPWELALNVLVMVGSVCGFADLTTLQGVLMDEYC